MLRTAVLLEPIIGPREAPSRAPHRAPSTDPSPSEPVAGVGDLGAPIIPPPLLDRRSRQVLLVVSPGVEPTRALVVTNLAAAFAEAGQQALIVTTADLRESDRAQDTLVVTPVGADPSPDASPRPPGRPGWPVSAAWPSVASSAGPGSWPRARGLFSGRPAGGRRRHRRCPSAGRPRRRGPRPGRRRRRGGRPVMVDPGRPGRRARGSSCVGSRRPWWEPCSPRFVWAKDLRRVVDPEPHATPRTRTGWSGPPGWSRSVDADVVRKRSRPESGGT